jgi:hypothetical protein
MGFVGSFSFGLSIKVDEGGKFSALVKSYSFFGGKLNNLIEDFIISILVSSHEMCWYLPGPARDKVRALARARVGQGESRWQKFFRRHTESPKNLAGLGRGGGANQSRWMGSVAHMHGG